MHAVVDTLLTNYTQIGDGSKFILFLHGWADSSKTFTSLATQVTKDNPEYTAILLDLPGFGGTQAPPTAWSLPDYAQYVASFIAKLKIDVDTIVGHSNGGAIAIHAVANNIIKTDRLVLIGSAGIRVKSAKKQLLRIAAKPAKLALMAAPKSTQKKIRQKLYGAIGSDYLIAEHMQETFKLIVSYDVQHEAGLIDVPTSLIYGANDTATPPTYGERLAALIPDSTLTIIPESGHFVHQEQIYKVARIINESIRGA